MTKIPPDLQSIIDAAILHLSDPSLPNPDLSPLQSWLETDGWDDVIDGIETNLIYLKDLMCDLNDEVFIEYNDIDDSTPISDADRIVFARDWISSKLEESMDSIHSITVQSKNMHSAVLCISMYYHGQGGAIFNDISIIHSIEEYIKINSPEVITDELQLSDSQIMENWGRSAEEIT